MKIDESLREVCHDMTSKKKNRNNNKNNNSHFVFPICNVCNVQNESHSL